MTIIPDMAVLPREFYLRETLTVARELLGKILVHRTPEGTVSGRIVEVEAYQGPEDPAAHSYQNRQRKRTAIQYGPGGFAYVYFIYGMHYCMNVVTREEDRPEAVLIRALEPVSGLELMEERRGRVRGIDLLNGPGKLCRALAIDKSCYGDDLCGKKLFIEDAGDAPDGDIICTPRINVDYAGEAAAYPWRFILRGSRYVSCPNKFR